MPPPARLVAVGRRHRDDPFYRYKMPAPDALELGAGNGVHTRLGNLDDVARALARPPAALAAFLAARLACRAHFDGDAWSVRGHPGAVAIADAVDAFVDAYVLCGRCGNPETACALRKGGGAELRCAACGERTRLEADRVVRKMAPARAP